MIGNPALENFQILSGVRTKILKIHPAEAPRPPKPPMPKESMGTMGGFFWPREFGKLFLKVPGELWEKSRAEYPHFVPGVSPLDA